MDSTRPVNTVGAFTERADHDEPSVFVPGNMLWEARRQRGLPVGKVPDVCLLDPDGDIVRHLVREGRVERSPSWACYHTELWETDCEGVRIGIVGCAVGASFAVLVAELSAAQSRPVVCFAHVTNTMAVVEGDFEKGPSDGAEQALAVVAAAAKGWRTPH